MMKRLKVTVLSFSYKRGLPADPTGNGGGHVFDCRCMPNPFWEEELRFLTGQDRGVHAFFGRFAGRVEKFMAAAEAIVRQSVEAYLEDGRENLQIAFGCTGGQHRSVYFAERMAERLAGTDGVEIELVHAASAFWKLGK